MKSQEPTNYCVHAMDDLTRFEQRLALPCPLSARGLHQITLNLEQAVKFLLPDGGLFDELVLKESFLDLLRLPYPLVALEAPWSIKAGLITEGPLQEVSSSKRIALLWDERHAPKSGFKCFNEPGIYVTSIFYDDHSKLWMTSALGAFLPRETVLTTLSTTNFSERSPADKLATEALLELGAVTNESSMADVMFFEVTPEIASAMALELGTDAASARMQLDVRDELHLAVEFCLTINCINVKTATLPAPAQLNKKRIKSGKRPFYSYEILELPEPSKNGGKPHPGVELEGLRAAPRQHTRRGHPRRLPDGKVTFVRSALVGQAAVGSVEKAYRLSSRK